jgi:acyl-CoA synthetase (AMP-forming)/AMP-acid ligase II
MLLIDLFDRGRLLNPDGICLLDLTRGETRVSWRDAASHTHRIAAQLREAGLGAGDAVGVLSPNDSLALLSVLGAARLDAPWVPLSAHARPEELAALLERTDARALIYHESLREVAAETLERLGGLELAVALGHGRTGDPDVHDWIGSGDDVLPRPAFEPGNTAILFPTGGTTGAPKAVQITHSVLTAMVLAMEAHMPESAPSTFAMAAPMTHAAGLTALATLATGGTVVVQDGVRGEALLETIERRKVTRLFLPPSAIYSLLELPGVGEFDFSSLRHLVYAAAPMSVEKLKHAMSVFGPVMTQVYGQAEAPMVITCMTPADHQAALDDPDKTHRLASVGRPTLVANVAIMNGDGELLDAGEIGEIVVRSSLVMPGYYKDEEQSSTTHRRHGWHGTHDAGYMDEDGFVYIVDRLRDMIITGGFNVWPSEIEQVIHEIPGVSDCAVIGVPDAKWGEAVTAVVEISPGDRVAEADVIALCKSRLGSVKAPKSVIFRDLPRSAVGKVLKRTLRDEYWSQGPLIAPAASDERDVTRS